MSVSSVHSHQVSQPPSPPSPSQVNSSRDSDGDNDGGKEVRASTPPGVGGNVDTDA